MQGFINVTLLGIVSGVLTVLTPNNEIKQFRQKGIMELSNDSFRQAILDGILHPKIAEIPDLPPEYHVVINAGSHEQVASKFVRIEGKTNGK